MGLDAAVYRNLRNLVPNVSTSIEIDERTGEPLVASDSGVNVIAAQVRLGNIAEIGRIRESIERMIGLKKSFILDRVVYSGSHTGDVIRFDELDLLSRELDQLNKLDTNESLLSFVASMRFLINTARAESNPIVF